MSINLNAADTPLVLLCLAWKKYKSARTIRANSTILHSRADDVVPYADSEELVRNSGLPAYTLIETESDHRLADPQSLEMMLEACGMGKDEEDDEEFLEINQRDWTGLCYTAVLAWRREAEEEWQVVHGTVWRKELGKRIDHAWCEREGFVVEMTLPEPHRIIAKETYYRTSKAEVRRSYSGEEACDLAVKHKHDGTWED